MTSITLEPTTHASLTRQITESQNPLLTSSSSAIRTTRARRPQLNEDAPEWLSFARDFGTTYTECRSTAASATATWPISTLTTTSGHSGFDSYSRESLTAHAMTSLLRVLKAHSEAPPAFEALRTAIKVIDSLAFDRAPTPQIAYLHPRGLEIEWLVQNRSVTASCYFDGVLFVWGTDNDDEELFEGEFPSGTPLSGDVYLQTVELLKLMGSDVRRRISPS